MKIDIEKPTIAQLKHLINNINDILHNRKMENDFPTFPQLKLSHLGSGQYSLTLQKYDSNSFKVIATKELSRGNKYDLTDFVFDKFYTRKEGA